MSGCYVTNMVCIHGISRKIECFDCSLEHRFNLLQSEVDHLKKLYKERIKELENLYKQHLELIFHSNLERIENVNSRLDMIDDKFCGVINDIIKKLNNKG